MAEAIAPATAEADGPSLTPGIYREATQIRANAVVLSRPPLFVPGSEAFSLEGTVTRQLQNNLIQVQTDLGAFTIRYSGGTQAIPANGARVPGAGETLLLTVSPSGTSVRAELAAPKTSTAPIGTDVQTLKGQAVLTSEAVRPAIALAQTAAARIVQNSMAPALSMQNPAPARAPSDPPPVGARPISQFEGSVVGSIKSSELWYQSSLAAGRDETGFRDPSMLKAFQDASQLRHTDPAQQIVSSFRSLSQPYHTMMEALLLLNPAIVSALTAKIPKANSSFGIGLMFFFLCLRHGGIRRWLGREAEREFELHEMEEMLDYLDQQVFPRMHDIPGYGKWAVAIAPFMLKEMSQFVWAVQESITGHRSRLPVHRFALQLPFERLGPVQFSGHVIGQTIDILCLTPRPLPSGLEETLRRNVPAIIAHHHMNGEIGFSYDSGLWIPFVKNLSLDRAV